MKQIEKIQFIGKEPQYICKNECFDGDWVVKHKDILTGQTGFEPNSVTTFSLEDYLPHDFYDYEILISVRAYTQSIINSKVSVGVGNGYIETCIGATYSRTALAECTGGNIIMPIKNNKKVVTIRFHETCQNIGKCYLYLSGYRRLGKSIGKSFSKLQIGDEELSINSPNLPGKWVKNYTTLVSSSSSRKNINVNDILTVDLNDVLPNDSANYEVIISGSIQTAPTTGAIALLCTRLLDSDWFDVVLWEGVSVSNAFRTSFWNLRLPIMKNQRKVELANLGTDSLGVEVYLNGYRRLGVF